jgi:hypothetical protein
VKKKLKAENLKEEGRKRSQKEDTVEIPIFDDVRIAKKLLHR